jgi:sulfur carrier protein
VNEDTMSGDALSGDVMSRVELNGRPRDVDPDTTVEDLVRLLVADPSGCAAAVNGDVVPRSDWQRRVDPGDRIEVLTAVQGG